MIIILITRLPLIKILRFIVLLFQILPIMITIKMINITMLLIIIIKKEILVELELFSTIPSI